MLRYTPVLIVLLPLVFGLACDDIVNCSNDNFNYLTAYFYRADTAYKVPTITVYGTVQPDSFFYNNKANLAIISFTLSPNQDSADVVMKFDNYPVTQSFLKFNEKDTDDFGNPVFDTVMYDSIVKISRTDTVHFKYNHSLRMINPECGYTHDYDIKDFRWTHHLIDTITLTDEHLNNEKTENIRIHF